MALLDVQDLSVAFTRRGEPDVTAVDGVTFTVDAGQVVGLVGESGCGKSVTSLALMGLLPRRGIKIGGAALFDGSAARPASGGSVARATGDGFAARATGEVIPRPRTEADGRAGDAAMNQAPVDLLRLDSARMRDIRGRDVAMIFQDPLSSLNPVIPIGVQVTEVLRRHRGLRGAAAEKEAAELLYRVGIPDPTRRIKEYPHQLSGGMRQRALIAMAVACRPRLLIADEPTTALDVTIQAQILELLKGLVREFGTALIMITHDLGVVAGMCDTVNVLYAGRIIETAARRPLFAAPRHPYTHGLLGSIPRLDAVGVQALTPIRGSVQDALPWVSGCAFQPRCDRSVDECVAGPPTLGEVFAGHEFRCVNPVTYEERL